MVQSVGGATGTANGGVSQLQDARNQALGSVADLFGESLTDLQSQLQSGQTLSSLASSNGISSSDLQKTIQDSLQQSLPQASSSQIDNLTQRLVSGHSGHHHHHAGSVSNSTSNTPDSMASATQPAADPSNPLHVVA
jgi:hypothetical protein